MESVNLKEQLALVEKLIIKEMMITTLNNQSEAARLLGISRGNLRAKLKAYEEQKLKDTVRASS